MSRTWESSKQWPMSEQNSYELKTWPKYHFQGTTNKQLKTEEFSSKNPVFILFFQLSPIQVSEQALTVRPIIFYRLVGPSLQKKSKFCSALMIDEDLLEKDWTASKEMKSYLWMQRLQVAVAGSFSDKIMSHKSIWFLWSQFDEQTFKRAVDDELTP